MPANSFFSYSLLPSLFHAIYQLCHSLLPCGNSCSRHFPSPHPPRLPTHPTFIHSLLDRLLCLYSLLLPACFLCLPDFWLFCPWPLSKSELLKPGLAEHAFRNLGVMDLQQLPAPDYSQIYGFMVTTLCQVIKAAEKISQWLMSFHRK